MELKSLTFGFIQMSNLLVPCAKKGLNNVVSTTNLHYDKKKIDKNTPRILNYPRNLIELEFCLNRTFSPQKMM